MHTFMEIVLMSVVLFFVLGGLGFFYVLISRFLSIPSYDNLEKIFPWMKE